MGGVPAKEALDADEHVRPVWLDHPEKAIAVAWDRAVNAYLGVLVEDAVVHVAGVQVDAAIVLVAFGVESHRGLLSGEVMVQPLAYRVGKPGWKGASNQYPMVATDGAGAPPLNRNVNPRQYWTIELTYRNEIPRPRST